MPMWRDLMDLLDLFWFSDCHCGLDPQSMNPHLEPWIPPDQVRGKLLQSGMTSSRINFVPTLAELFGFLLKANFNRGGDLLDRNHAGLL